MSLITCENAWILSLSERHPKKMPALASSGGMVTDLNQPGTSFDPCYRQIA